MDRSELFPKGVQSQWMLYRNAMNFYNRNVQGRKFGCLCPASSVEIFSLVEQASSFFTNGASDALEAIDRERNKCRKAMDIAHARHPINPVCSHGRS
jgi:hypothetical protein